uniref:Putative high light inducible protein n=1 Tax=uncultured Prochlorococcus marinus clone ASNC3046 TaxID=379369 RepID=Q1PKX4_PROMR|nr:putative high light inducible protein [uncultured Prochlorococcus marinus clone ASNC3046]
MIEKKEDNIRSESYYPDSNYYIDQDNTSKEKLVPDDQISNIGVDFEWPNTYWFIAERTNGRLAMIGFMAVIINYTLFGWIAYPIL